MAGVDARRGLVTLATRARGSDQVFRMRVASLDDSRTATTEVRGCKNAEPVLGGPGGTCRAVASAGGPKAAWGRQGGSSVRHGPSETGVAWGSVIGATGEVRPAEMMRVFFYGSGAWKRSRGENSPGDGMCCRRGDRGGWFSKRDAYKTCANDHMDIAVADARETHRRARDLVLPLCCHARNTLATLSHTTHTHTHNIHTQRWRSLSSPPSSRCNARPNPNYEK